METLDIQAVTLLQLLSNTLILDQTIPYLPISSTLALGATSKSFRELIHHTPKVFRHLDLRNNKLAQSANIGTIDSGGQVFRARRVDEGVTEADFYSGPLKGIFNNLLKRNALKDVQTLILDGLALSASIPIDIILNSDYNVRILSLREVQNLQERSLIGALKYAIRNSRPEGTPKLQGLYLFGPKDPPISKPAQPPLLISGEDKTALAASIGSSWNQKSSDHLSQSLYGTSSKWYCRSGRMIRNPLYEWGSLLLECQDIISFDAPLCSGPRHTLPIEAKTDSVESVPWYQKEEAYITPRVATFALGGCHSCGKGSAKFGTSPDHRFPLLSPIPTHSSTIKAAKKPESPLSSPSPYIVARCEECLRHRYCETCFKWWCEECYDISPKGHNLHPLSMIPPQPVHDAVASLSEQLPEHMNESKKVLESHDVKVYSGLCVENCLIGDLLANDIWG